MLAFKVVVFSKKLCELFFVVVGVVARTECFLAAQAICHFSLYCIRLFSSIPFPLSFRFPSVFAWREQQIVLVARTAKTNTHS